MSKQENAVLDAVVKINQSLEAMHLRVGNIEAKLMQPTAQSIVDAAMRRYGVAPGKKPVYIEVNAPFEQALLMMRRGHLVRREAWPSSTHIYLEDGQFRLTGMLRGFLSHHDILGMDWMVMEKIVNVANAC